MTTDAKTADARIAELGAILDKRYMTPEKALRLLRLFREGYAEPPKHLLEIGTFAGTGAIQLAEIVRPWGGHVTTVDLAWTGRPNEHFQKTVDDWRRELDVDNLTIVRRPDGGEGFLLDYLRQGCRPQLDFCYIDGGHTVGCVAAQFALSLAALKPGSWIVFDDIANAKWPEVGDVWRYVVCPLVPPERRSQEGQFGFVQIKS